MPARSGRPAWVLPVLLGAVFLGAVGLLLRQAQALPDGPVPVLWDKASCAHCRMAVSEPPFAAQLQLRDGRVFEYDDPGCLLSALQRHPSDAIHAVWVHHHREDRWLPRTGAAFARVSPTPMGFGFGAVDAFEAGAVTWDEAAAEVRSRGASSHGGVQ